MSMQEDGEEIEITPREIEIYEIELLSAIENEKEIQYRVKCSKGTYIRTLCEDIALQLGTLGYMKELKRTQVGDFYIKDAIKISEIDNYNAEKNLITVEKFFEDKEKVVLKENELKKFLNGVKIKTNLEDEIYRIYDSNLQFIGIGEINDKLLKRDVIDSRN